MKMKRGWMIVLLAAMLTGCAQQEVFETVADELESPVLAAPRQISVRLPEDTVVPVLESDQEQVYLCDDYELILQTLSSGDLDATVQTLSGCTRDSLTLVNTRQGDTDRYDFVWTCAGEKGDMLGRGVILDDGNYHYCMSVLRSADETQKSQIVWSDVFGSFSIAP